MPKRAEHYALTDHLCRHCGGRVLMQVAGGGASGGGNPTWRCADCGYRCAAMSADVICWCGFHHRGQHAEMPYRCMPLAKAKDEPGLARAFRANGFDPDSSKAEVGVVSYEAWRAFMTEDGR